MSLFLIPWIIALLGVALHTVLDRNPTRRSARRIVELSTFWLIGSQGAFALIGLFGHDGPNSTATAHAIGYAPSMFQWETGWADAALGVLLLLAVLPRNRGPWLTAALTATLVSLGGDGIGHIMQLCAHANHAPENVWAIPSDFVFPVLAIALTWLYRHYPPQTTGPRAEISREQLVTIP